MKVRPVLEINFATIFLTSHHFVITLLSVTNFGVRFVLS